MNPNERSAREGELIALEFMMGMNPDPTMKAYIEKSINSYKSYQDKVLANFAELDVLESQLKAIEGQIRSSETKNIIRARMDYLKALKQQNLLNVSGVERSVDQALGIKAELSSDAPLMGE